MPRAPEKSDMSCVDFEFENLLIFEKVLLLTKHTSCRLKWLPWEQMDTRSPCCRHSPLHGLTAPGPGVGAGRPNGQPGKMIFNQAVNVQVPAPRPSCRVGCKWWWRYRIPPKECQRDLGWWGGKDKSACWLYGRLFTCISHWKENRILGGSVSYADRPKLPVLRPQYQGEEKTRNTCNAQFVKPIQSFP